MSENGFRVLMTTPHDVRCPHCGAGLYEYCVDSRGRHVSTLLHAARRRRFVEARNRLRDAGLLIEEPPEQNMGRDAR